MNAIAPTKRKNTSAKGAAIERKAMRILEAQGYLVHRTVRAPVFRGGMHRGGQSNDVFGCFDLVAVKLGSPVRFVQVTVKGKAREKERKAAPVARCMSTDVADVEVWAFVGGRKPDGQRFQVTQWNAAEWADCADEECVADALKARAA